MQGGSLQSRVSRFLARYRVTPQATTGSSPAVLIGRKVRCVLDNIKPDLAGRVLDKQGAQKFHHDKHATGRSFKPNDAVYYRDYSSQTPDRYSSGVVKRRTGPVSAEIETPAGVHRCHLDQLFHRDENIPPGQQPHLGATTLPPEPHCLPPPPPAPPDVAPPQGLPVSLECPSTESPLPGPLVPSTRPGESHPIGSGLQGASPSRDGTVPDSLTRTPTSSAGNKNSSTTKTSTKGVLRHNPERNRRPPKHLDIYCR